MNNFFGFSTLKEKYAKYLNAYISNLGFVPNITRTINGPILSSEDIMKFGFVNTFKNNWTIGVSNAAKKMEGYYPKLGIFCDTDQKIFAVRTYAEEINPKVYKFSQLQDFEMSQDVRESMRGAIYSYGIAIGFGGKTIAGNLTLRIVVNGVNGPEALILQAFKDSGVKTTNSFYLQQGLEGIKAIADCLQWIHNNA